MSTEVVAELLRDGGIEVREIADHDEVVSALQQSDADRPRQLWTFYTDIESSSAPSLTIGLNGEIGALEYWDGQCSHLPAEGSNPEAADYWWGGHHSPVDPHAELPAPEALRALREFLRTHRMPACVDWELND